jgi:putative membrane protein
MRSLLVAIAVFCAAALGAARGIGQDSENDPARRPGNAPAEGAAVAPTPAEILSNLHQANLNEIKFGTLATKQSHAPEVRRFGQKLVKDHTVIDTNLGALAADKQIELEKKTDPRAEDNMKRLEGLEGEAFDRAFLTLMIEEHEKGIVAIDEGAPQMADRTVRDFLESLVPQFEEHRQIAETMLAKMQPPAKR